MALVPFKSNSTFCVIGCTNSGKTYWVKKLLENVGSMFEDEPPVSIKYCYGVDQELFKSMEQELSPLVHFQQGLPTQEEIQEFTPDRQHRIIILDDLMSQVANSQTMQDLFCQYCHHRHLSVIFISQNLYEKGSKARSISLNVHYFIFLKNFRNRSQIAHLGRQLFPRHPYFMLESYEDCIKEPYGYLVVDISPHSQDEYRLRSHIFPEEYPVVYKANS